MSFSAINRTLMSLVDGVTHLNGHNITWVFPNSPLDEERLETANYAYLYLESMQAFSRDLCGSLVERDGLFTINLYAAVGELYGLSDDLVDGILAIFENKELEVRNGNRLVTQFMNLTDLGNSGFYIRTIVIPFKYWEYR